MAATLGINVYLEVSVDGITYVKLGMQTDTTLNRKADKADKSNKDDQGFKTSISGLRDWSIDAPFIFDSQDAGYAIIEAAWIAGTNIYARCKENVASHVRYHTGLAHISDLTIAAPNDKPANSKCTLDGAGPLVLTTS